VSAPAQFSRLMSPIKLGDLEIPNRIIFGPHDTGHGLNSDGYLAYLRARAEGGAGLIITGFVGVHRSGSYGPSLDDDVTAAALAELVRGLAPFGARLFVQIGHMGRHMPAHKADGSRRLTWGPSSGHTSSPSNAAVGAMPVPFIREIIDSFALAAAHVKQAGVDGIEVCASHDTLPSSFLAAKVNKRQDDYGGSFSNRFRFIREILLGIRSAVGPNFPVGIRLSADDCDNVGIEPDEAILAAEAIDREHLADFIHVARGGDGTLRGLTSAVAPMNEPDGVAAAFSRPIKMRVSLPVIANGRINQPQVAEAILARGDADAICLVRPLICDANYALKVRERRSDDIRACIACNQACIGHEMQGYPISCIQSPESGRETIYGTLPRADHVRRVLVVGGGPAGMKAAATAALRGHQVTLCEASSHLGGQVLLGQQLPGRDDFGGVVTNLRRELEIAGVEIRLNTRVDRQFVEQFSADAIVLATGGKPVIPDIERDDNASVVTAWEVLRGEIKVGARIVIADFIGDGIAPGIAELLRRQGTTVRLATVHTRLGEAITFGGDYFAGRMYDLDIPVVPYARLFGVDSSAVYFEHVVALKPIVMEGVDTIVVCYGNLADDALSEELNGLAVPHQRVGDCAAPRTVEEAILEGYIVGREL
jgi:2,4-dienoyl-CoA reductase-like NADH-dependent reductase (Old Yellow Enzyme family)